MTWAVHDLQHAGHDLTIALQNRAQGANLPSDTLVARSPVGMVFIRGDRAEPGASLAKQVVSSYAYWNDDTSKYLDLVFFGWAEECGELSFDHKAFLHCRDQVQSISKWCHSGESDVLLLDFEAPLRREAGFMEGRFLFGEAIPLRVEDMIRDKRFASLDSLFHQLVAVAKAEYDRAPMQGGTWEISDHILYLRGRRSVWEVLKKLVLRDWSRVYNEARDFAVCDLSLDQSGAA
jgi:hypothetical protein